MSWIDRYVLDSSTLGCTIHCFLTAHKTDYLAAQHISCIGADAEMNLCKILDADSSTSRNITTDKEIRH